MASRQSFQAFGCLTFFSCILFCSYAPTFALTDVEQSYITRRQLLALRENGKLPDGYEYTVKTTEKFENERLRRAFIALQAWKKAMYSDPKNITSNWFGPNVCDYKGVYCVRAMDDPKLKVVAGIDLNHADIAGYLPVELGLLTDVALIHLNSNRFCGIIPESLSELTLMHEFDVSNNRFVGDFPKVVLSWPSVKFIDLRFNNFEGCLPPELFKKDLDALFLNDNRFTCNIPETIGKSTVSVVTFANNKFKGCIPRSIGKMSNLDEIIFSNNNLGGCFPQEIGLLRNVTIFDVSKNSFVGSLPANFSGFEKVDVLDISGNKLTGSVPEDICKLPSLSSFKFSYNYFSEEHMACIKPERKNIVVEDTGNCVAGRMKQKTDKECKQVVSNPVDCSKDKCTGGSPPSKPKSPPLPPVHSPPHHVALPPHHVHSPPHPSTVPTPTSTISTSTNSISSSCCVYTATYKRYCPPTKHRIRIPIATSTNVSRLLNSTTALTSLYCIFSLSGIKGKKKEP
uniref:Cell wall hydroxyproline-rich glycoprotein n=1 Tax=Gossypium raimondii TaxID=29730 RepID=A0A0D2W2N2_GOSRA|nr:hypothetical protein B456_013G040300 [Gossypium raimondii]